MTSWGFTGGNVTDSKCPTILVTGEQVVWVPDVKCNRTRLSRSYHPSQPAETSCLYWNKWLNEVMSVAPSLFVQWIISHYATCLECSRFITTHSLNLLTLLDFWPICYFTSPVPLLFSLIMYSHTHSPPIWPISTCCCFFVNYLSHNNLSLPLSPASRISGWRRK